MHAMIDLETLSTSPNAVVTQIGVALFSPDRKGVHHTLQLQLDPDEQIRAGRQVSWSTVKWWLSQGDEAREAMHQPPTGTSAVAPTLLRLNEFLLPYKPKRVWAYGAAFDFPILKTLYDGMENATCLPLPVPWTYRQEMCLRTAVQFSTVQRPDAPGRPSVAHRAIDDAVNQAMWLQAMIAGGLQLPEDAL